MISLPTSCWRAVVVVLALGELAVAQDSANLTYQRRGDYYEGIRSSPSTGTANVALIGALIDYEETYTALPDAFKVKFHLERESEVYVTVRERDPKHFYWLDRVRAENAWRPGLQNLFEWPTGTVIRYLNKPKLGLYDLVALARLDKPDPGLVERVAPVALYHSNAPRSSTGYVFTFRPSGRLRLTASIYGPGSKQAAVHRQTFRRTQPEIAFTLKWDAAGSPEGQYRLVAKGYESRHERRGQPDRSLLSPTQVGVRRNEASGIHRAFDVRSPCSYWPGSHRADELADADAGERRSDRRPSDLHLARPRPLDDPEPGAFSVRRLSPIRLRYAGAQNTGDRRP